MEKGAETFRIWKLIKECKGELTNNRPIFLGNAVHVSRKVYLEVREQYEKIAELYLSLSDKVNRDEFGTQPYYKENTLNILRRINNKTIFCM